MDVKFGYSQFMPSPYAVYLSNFSEATLKFLKGSTPFARYHKEDKEYEITPELYEDVKRLGEPFQELNRLPSGKLYEEFIYGTDYDYQYQDDAVRWFRNKSSVLINFSQGMGKSFTTLKMLYDRGSKKSLIITGMSNLQEEWAKDAYKHKTSEGVPYAELLNMAIVAGDPAASVPKRIKYLRESHIGQDVFTDLISIESLRNEELVAALNDLHYDAVVVDEIQAAKGMKAEQTEGLHELVRHDGQLRLALSGTPALNDPLEYYSVLRFLGVLYYKSPASQCSRSAFNKYYGDWGFDYWGHFVCKGYRNLGQLRELIAPILVYAPKSLLNLPPKHRYLIHQKVQNPRYEELCELYDKGSRAVKKAGYKTIQALASELQVITSTDETKIRFILDKIEQGARPLVFSQYTTVLDIVKKRLEEEGWTAAIYDGRLNSKQRLAVLENWKDGSGDVLLLSIATARYGLNLQETQVAIFLEPSSSPAILEQAEDRLHRIGQTKDVYSYILLSGKSDHSDWENIQRKIDSLAFQTNASDITYEEVYL